MPKGHAPKHLGGAAPRSTLRARSAQHAWTRAPQQATRSRVCTPPRGASAQGLARRGSGSSEPWTPGAPNSRQRIPISSPRSPQSGWIPKPIQPPSPEFPEPTAPAPSHRCTLETHPGALQRKAVHQQQGTMERSDAKPSGCSAASPARRAPMRPALLAYPECNAASL